MTIDGVVHRVNDSVTVNLSVRDPDGNIVEQDLPVELIFDSVNNASGVIIEDWGLKEAELLDNGVGVRGLLGLDGQSVVVLTSTLPDELELTLRAQDAQSIVREDQTDLVFEAGEMEQVEILLPTQSFTATAGQSFDAEIRVLDAFGNLVEDESATVLLFEECGGFLDEVTVVGSLVVPLSVNKATGIECPRNRIQAISGLQGMSESFAVLAGPLTQFHGVQVNGQNQFIAGESSSYRVTGQDQFSNPVDLDGVELIFEDSLDSLASAECTLSSPEVFRSCELIFEASVEETSLTVTALEVDAELGVYEVLPNVAAQLLVGAIGGTLVAGSLFELEVSITDAWGNPVNVNGNQTPFSVTDGGFFSLECNWLGSQVEGVHVLSCIETTASEHMQFTVSVDALGVNGVSDIVEVVNGALQSVTLTATDQTLVAGDLFDLQVAATDAYGNPYLTQSNANLILTDSASGLNKSQAQLGSSGTVLVNDLVLEKVGSPVVLRVSQGGLQLGSLNFQVSHGSVDHLLVKPARTWAWVGVPRSVDVVAVDLYENPVLNFQESVQLSSATSAFLTLSASGFDSGSLTTALTWDSAQLGDQINAVSTSVSGTSDLLDSVLADCVNPPTADFMFDASGGDELVTCFTGNSVNLGIDFSNSSAGAEPLAFYHFYDGQGQSERTTSSVQSLSVESVGAWLPELMLVDSGACGHLVDGVLWAGENDGSVTGPVSIGSSQSSLVSGSSSQGSATLNVSALDCAGDVASSVALFARTNLGELDPNQTALTATGEGLSLVLDGAGTGSVDFSVASSSFPGKAVISVGNTNGAAYGEVEIVVSGDNAQPQVAWVDPMGTTSEQLNEVHVQFTEPMASSTVNATNVSLEDTNGDSINFLLSFSAGNSRAILELDDPLDTSSEAVTLRLSSDVRDSAGNFLDGDFSGNLAGSAFEAVFGDVQDDGLTLQSCVLQESQFVPDGDASSNVGQADEAYFSLTSSGVGEFWVLEVYDSAGERIRTLREPTAGVSSTLEWDGTGDDGLLQESGSYMLSATVQDAQGNWAASCLDNVQLRQLYFKPERQE
jgi:hypothetical protein